MRPKEQARARSDRPKPFDSSSRGILTSLSGCAVRLVNSALLCFCIYRTNEEVAMPQNDADEIARYADMFSALGAEPRLRIVRLLLAAHPEGLVVGEIGAEPEPCGARLPGDYGADAVLRPRRRGRHKAVLEDTGRFFLCERCRTQVLICSCCDRGQIYCAGGCAPLARAERRREVARRYQKSRNGRFAHADRSRRYRGRHKNVTHQGSPEEDVDACLVTASAAARISAPDPADTPPTTAPAISMRPAAGILGRRCHWCGRCCSPFVRGEPLRRRPAIRFSPSRG